MANRYVVCDKTVVDLKDLKTVSQKIHMYPLSPEDPDYYIKLVYLHKDNCFDLILDFYKKESADRLYTAIIKALKNTELKQ